MMHYAPVTPTGDQIRAFLQQLAAAPRQRIALEQLWQILAVACPVRPQGSRDREWLLTMLAAAHEAGQVRLPAESGPHWDRTQQPILPAWVERVATRVARPRPWRTVAWHPALAWVASLDALAPRDQVMLERLNTVLRHGGYQELVPRTLRSLELTGDEKRLTEMGGSALFRADRLTWALLGCQPDVHPMAWERVGSGGRVLVVENHETFVLVTRLLDQHRVTRTSTNRTSSVPYDVIAYGNGLTAPVSIGWLTRLTPAPTALHYLGDLDRFGLDIALATQNAANAYGLPVLEPAPGLHARMLARAAELDHPIGWPRVLSRRPARSDDDLVAFLPPALQEGVRNLLVADHRIPEEVLAPADWRSLLGLSAVSWETLDLTERVCAH